MVKSHQQLKKRCIFCENEGVTKEHMYLNWIGQHLSSVDEPSYVEELRTYTNKTKLVGQSRKNRPGHVTTKKVRAPCASCNNGWMNCIEINARPFLQPMIKGEGVLLTAYAQEAIARWVALKVIVGEYAVQNQSVTPRADRKALMEMGTVPDFFNIYAGRNNSLWSTGYYRHSGTISLALTGPIPPLSELAKNVQQVTMIVGSLVIHVNAAHVDNFRLEDRINLDLHEGIKLWPISRDSFEWADIRSLSAHDIGVLAGSFEELTAHPKVAWGGNIIPS